VPKGSKNATIPFLNNINAEAVYMVIIDFSFGESPFYKMVRKNTSRSA
jgi:hypothetical protein